MPGPPKLPPQPQRPIGMGHGPMPPNPTVTSSPRPSARIHDPLAEKKEEYKKKRAVVPTNINEKNYWQQVGNIFVYPLRKKILWSTLGATVFFTIMNFTLYVPFYGFIIGIMMGCYFIGCVVHIIQTAVSTEDENVFEWPDFLSWMDWFGTTLLFILAVMISYAPAFFYFKFFQRLDAVLIALGVMAMYINPMYILAISLVGGIESLNIINVFKAVKHTFIPYTLTVLFLAVLQAASVLTGMTPLIKIPVLGAFIKWFFSIYFLFVNMRFLGIFYRAHRLRLRWFEEEL
jgi:hypothetical protein